MTTTPQRVALLAPLSGVLVPLERVPDPVFAQRTVGEGVLIDPTSSERAAVRAGDRLRHRQGRKAPAAAAVSAAGRGFRADGRLVGGADSGNANSGTASRLLAARPTEAIRVSAWGPDGAAAVRALAA